MTTRWALLLAVVSTGCVSTQSRGTQLVFFEPHLPLAEGLFTTWELQHSTDDCGKLDVPGFGCTMNTWDFDGTTLEVDAPAGFEVIGSGLDKNYWFSVRCNQAGEGDLAVRVKDGDGVRYEGTTKVACARPAQLSVLPTSIADQSRPGFGSSFGVSEFPPSGVPIVQEASLTVDVVMKDEAGQELFGFGRTVVSADGAVALKQEEAPPTLPGAGQMGLQLLATKPGQVASLRVGQQEAPIPVRPVADADWQLEVTWNTYDTGTRVVGRGAMLSNGETVYGLTNCFVTITDATGDQPVQNGDCNQYWQIPNATRVCVQTRGKNACK